MAMDIYYYCSYDGSASGFRILRLTESSPGSGKFQRSDKEINPFIRRCFESGMIQSAFGRIPSESGGNQDFFILKKKMLGKRNNRTYYMNMAIVEDEWEKFKGFFAGCAEDEETFLGSMIESIEPKKDDTYGYEINDVGLKKVLDACYKDLCDCSSERLRKVKNEDVFYTTLISKSPNQDLLKKELVLAEREMCKEDEKLFIFKKKCAMTGRMAANGTVKKNMLITAVVFLAVVILGVIIFIKLRR